MHGNELLLVKIFTHHVMCLDDAPLFVGAIGAGGGAGEPKIPIKKSKHIFNCCINFNQKKNQSQEITRHACH